MYFLGSAGIHNDKGSASVLNFFSLPLVATCTVYLVVFLISICRGVSSWTVCVCVHVAVLKLGCVSSSHYVCTRRLLLLLVFTRARLKLGSVIFVLKIHVLILWKEKKIYIYIYHTHHFSRHQSFFFFLSLQDWILNITMIGLVVDDVVRHWGKASLTRWILFFSICFCVTEKGAHFNGWVCFPGLQWDVKNKKANFQSWRCFEINPFCSLTVE